MSYVYRIYFETLTRTAKAVGRASNGEIFRACIFTLRRLDRLRKKKIDLKPLWNENKLAPRLARVNTYRILIQRYRKEQSREKRTQKIYINIFSLFPLLLSLLPEKARREIFEPSFNDLMADLFSTLRQCKTKAARHRLIRRFLFRGIFT